MNVQAATPLPGVTVVIPAFNEEAAMARQLGEILAVMKQSGWTFEIIVVDDGSTDSTASLAEGCGVKVLRLGCNRGYGAALKAGIQAAAHDRILIIDADGTYPALAIPRLLERASSADMVVGARVGANLHIPMTRRPAKWLLGQYANLLARRRIPDLNSGLRLMQKSSLRTFWDVLPPGFSFTTTITLAMLATGHEVSYVKIDYLPRLGKSKIRPTDFFRFLWLITKMALRFHPLRILFPLGLLSLPVSAAFLYRQSLASHWLVPGLACAVLAWTAGLVLERRARLERGKNGGRHESAGH